MKVAVVISYYSPKYIRGQSIISALKGIPEVELSIARNHSRGIRRYFESISQLIKLERNIDPDLYVLPFRAHEIFPFVRFIVGKKPTIFDEMLSPYDSLISEGKRGLGGKLVALFLRPFESWILNNSDIVLTDTQLHADHISELFEVDESKFKVLPVSTEPHEDGIHWKGISKGDSLNIFFYGTFQRLHGVDVILDVIEKFTELPIHFTIVGGKGHEDDPIVRRIEEKNYRNLEHHYWMEFDKLMNKACEADLCLGGPFGNTGQGQRVITGKTYQFLNLGIPTVVGTINEDTGFIDRENCLLVEQGSAEELADRIKWAYENKSELDRIGKGGKLLFDQRYSIPRLTEIMKELIFKYQSNV